MGRGDGLNVDNQTSGAGHSMHENREPDRDSRLLSVRLGWDCFHSGSAARPIEPIPDDGPFDLSE